MKFIIFLLFAIYLGQNVDVVQSQYKVKDTSGCVFPFNYGGRTYTKCTKGMEKNKWCSYTKDFQGVWKYCNDMRQTDWKCVGKCMLYRKDTYPSCRSNKRRRRIYCTDDIKYLVDSDTEPSTDKCPEKYKKIPLHTGCLATSKYVTKEGLTEADKKNIVDLHDQYRMKVKTPAKSMMKMHWDDDLAYMAQKHASRCSFAHDQPHLRAIVNGKNSGQNIVRLTGHRTYNISQMFFKMYRTESMFWEYGVGIKPRFKRYRKKAGHYTQALLDHVSRIGCGMSECVFRHQMQKFYVCNYDNMQFGHEMEKPYEEGEWCSGCMKGKCVNKKLCDCGNRECSNGGEMDPKTCTCKCKDFWKGDHCETEIVPEKKDGCMIPFKDFSGKLQYGCVKDPDNYYDHLVCSKEKQMSWESMIECKDKK